MDPKLYCKVPFGGYAQIYVKQKDMNNVLQSRTVGGISLGPMGNMQGTYRFISLEIGCIIKAKRFMVLPIPSDVIDRVNSMGQQEINEIASRNRAGETINDVLHSVVPILEMD